MSRFTVVWSDEAQNELAALWLENQTEREAITAASHLIDTELANDPAQKGIDVTEGLRELEAAPLRVLFVVEDLDRMVRVVLVRPAAPTADPERNGDT